MKLSEILEKKTVGVVDLKTILGDKYSNLEVDLDEVNSDLFTKNFLSLSEAENNAEIISKNKHNWHQVASKSLYDSIDSSLGDLTGLLETIPEKTPAKVKAALDKYKEIVANKDQESGSLKVKIAELEAKLLNNTSPETKAILEDKNYQIENLKKTTVDKTEFDAIKLERDQLAKDIKRIDASSLQDAIVTQALSSNILADFWKENKMRDKMVVEAVKDYIKDEKFGFGNVAARLVFDEDRRIKVIQKDNDMPIIVNNENLSLQEIVKAALIKNDMIQKSDSTKMAITFQTNSKVNRNITI